MSTRKALLVVAVLIGVLAPSLAEAKSPNGSTCSGGGNCTSGICGTNAAGSSICCAASCAAGSVCLSDGSGCCPSAQACGTTCCGAGIACSNAGTSTCACPNTTCSGTCCAAGQVCNAGTNACCTTTASCAGMTCGTVSDGCGHTLTCGTCPAGQSCSASNNCVAGCTPKTCATGPYTCGTNIPDGCGGTIASCGAAGACSVAGQVCQNNTTCCTPKTCAGQGYQCGTAFNGCGDAIDCGTCAAAGSSCVNNQCVACTPLSCASAGKNCGSISDGCGGTLSCGTCTTGTCGGGGVTNVCGSGVVSQPRPFSAGALIIPMDQCYNPDYAAGADYVSDGTTCSAGALTACYANYSTGNVRLPFGLLYLLAVNNIPVNIILNPTKRGLGDPDFSVTPYAGATNQTSSYVAWNGSAYAVSPTLMTCGTNTVYYGGMPFVVDGPYADQALQLITQFNAAHGNLFAPVPLHIINYDFQAPVLGVMASRPKPVAIDGPPLDTYFSESGITSVVPNGSTYVTINGTAPNFSFTWPSAAVGPNPGCPGDNCTSLTWAGPPAIKIVDVIWVHNPQYNQWSDIGTFYNLGGTALVVADATQWETNGPGVGGTIGPAANGAQKGPYCATDAVSGANLNAQPGPTNDYPASNKFLQIGDMSLFVHGVGGGDASAYQFGSSPATHTHALTNTVNYTAIAGHPMVNGTQAPGDVVYLGSLNSWHGGAAGKDAGLHIMYNTLLVGGDGGASNTPGLYPTAGPFSGVELSRSGPVGRPSGEYYVGTFDWLIPKYPTLAGNQLYVPSLSNYPYVTGHFREFKSVNTANAGQSGLINIYCDETDPNSACNWDLADHIDAWSTRQNKVFVGVKSGSGATATYTMTAASSLAGDATITFIGNNIGARLGGVDWASGAYIEQKPNSSVTGAKTRPPVAYVGARDGMLHAICADPNGCYGQPWKTELWAFIPPSVKTQMDYARTTSNDWSQINVGGSIRAADVTDTFTGSTASSKTVLLVGTREGSSVFALEVSNPDPSKVNQDGNLKLLWETDAVNNIATGVTAYPMGKTRGAVMATMVTKNTVMAVVTSNVNGTAAQSGLNTYLLRITNGQVVSSNQKLFTRREPLAGGSTGLLANDVPPAATTVDLDGDGTDETVIVPDAEGIVRELKIDPANLVFSGAPTTVFDTISKCANSALSCQPIGASASIGRYGTASPEPLAAFVGTGGADWARSTTVHSYALGFALGNGSTQPGGATILDRDLGTVTPPVSTTAGGTSNPMPLRAYSQLSIAGTDLYADTTTLSLGNMNQMVLPVLYPGTYGQIERWGNLNTGTIDASATYLITQGQNFSGGIGAVLESGSTGTQGELTFTGTSTTDRIVLQANSSSLKNSAYAVTQTSGSRLFTVLTWFDLGY